MPPAVDWASRARALAKGHHAPDQCHVRPASTAQPRVRRRDRKLRDRDGRRSWRGERLAVARRKRSSSWPARLVTHCAAVAGAADIVLVGPLPLRCHDDHRFGKRRQCRTGRESTRHCLGAGVGLTADSAYPASARSSDPVERR